MDLKKKNAMLERKYQKLMTQFLAAQTDSDKHEIIIEFSKLGYRNKFGKAVYFVGLCYETGNGVPQSWDNYSAYRNAAEMGYFPAYYKTAEDWERSYHEALSGKDSCFDMEDAKDFKEYALNDYLKLAQRNDAASLFRIAQLYTSWPHYSLEKAEKWYKRVIAQDNQPLLSKAAKSSLNWCYEHIDVFNKIKNGREPEIKEGKCMKVGDKLLRKPEEVIILNGCNCDPDIKCFFCNDGRYYKESYNSFECVDKLECFSSKVNRMDIRDIKVRAESFPASEWEYV